MRNIQWHIVLDVVLRVIRVLAIALAGATADEALFDGHVGERLAAPLPELSSKSWGAELGPWLQARSQSE